VHGTVAIIPYALRALVLLLCLLPLLGQKAAAHSPHDRITGLAVSAGFDTDQTVFCTLIHSNTFILRSVDGGNTWHPSQIGFPHRMPSCIELSPDFVQDGVGFVGTEQGTVFRSTDGGLSWAPANSTPLGTVILDIACSPDYGVDETLFIGSSGQGIYMSTDGGDTWTAANTGLGDFHVNEIAISPDFATDNTLFAATEHGLFKSVDRGANWFNPLSSGISQFIAASVAVSPGFTQDDVVYVGVRYWGVFRSDDGGANWTWRGAGLPELNTNRVALSPSFDMDETLFVATTEGVYQSLDAGLTWDAVDAGLAPKADQTDDHYRTFAFSRTYATDKTIFLAGWEGVHLSDADTTNWRQLNVFNQNMVRGLAISPGYGSDGTLFAGTYGGGVYRSQDHGDTWIARDTSLQGIFIADLCVSPTLPTDYTVFVGNAKGLERSLSGGNAWHRINVNPNDFVYFRCMAVSPGFATDETLLGGNGSEGTYELYKSTDGGDTFVPIGTDFDGAYCLAFSPAWTSDQTVYAGTNRGVYSTSDGAVTWNAVGIPGEDILCLALSGGYGTDGTVFAGSRDTGVHRSTDFGATWVLLDNGITDHVIQALCVSPNFQTDGTVLAATKSGGVFVSTDSGDTWTSAGLEGSFLREMVISPEYATDQTIFVGAWDGVHRTENNGQTWERVLLFQRWDDQSDYIARTSHWSVYKDALASAKRLIHADDAAAKADMHFVGDSIRWIGATAPFGGIAQVFIDGTYDADVDLYSASVNWQKVVYTKTGLGPGPHYIYITNTGTNNPNSTGTKVIIDAFEVIE